MAWTEISPVLVLKTKPLTPRMSPLEHHTAGDGDVFAFEFIIIVADLGSMMGLVIFDDHEGIISGCLELRQLLAADLLQLGYILSLLLSFLLIILLVLLLILFSHCNSFMSNSFMCRRLLLSLFCRIRSGRM